MIITFENFFIEYRILHVYQAQSYDFLKNLLQRHAKVTQFDAIEPKKLYGLNVWIIHVIGENRRMKLLDVLKKSQLQFDSHVFEFFESDQGTISNTFRLTHINKNVLQLYNTS